MTREMSVDQLLNKYEQTNELKYFFEAFKKFTNYVVTKGYPCIHKGNKTKKDITEVPFTAWRSRYASNFDARHVNAWLMRKDIQRGIQEGTPRSILTKRWELTVEQLSDLLKI